MNRALAPLVLSALLLAPTSCAKTGREAPEAISTRSFAPAPAAMAEPAPELGLDKKLRSDANASPLAGGPAGPWDGAASAPRPAAERKLVHRASLRLRVESLAEAEKAVLALVGRFAGYVASSSASESYLSMSLRIPAASFDAALSAFAPLGRTLERSESAEDVTLAYYDLEGRLATKRELAATLRGYLKKAASIEDIMAVETRLAELSDEIDRLGSDFAGLANLVDYATIDLELVPPASTIEPSSPGLGDKLAGLFRELGGFFTSLLAGLVALVLYGIPLLALAAFLFWLLFGKLGLLVSLWRLVARRKPAASSPKTGA